MDQLLIRLLSFYSQLLWRYSECESKQNNDAKYWKEFLNLAMAFCFFFFFCIEILLEDALKKRKLKNQTHCEYFYVNYKISVINLFIVNIDLTFFLNSLVKIVAFPSEKLLIIYYFLRTFYL